MQRRPPAAVSSLTPTMSPPLPRRRESHASQDSSPRTPPNSTTPLPFMPPPSQNRYSSDSWNSSNYSGMEDLEAEWNSEQTRLLIRTLDALPAHLLTPFNGPVPPSNLLDKIARGVAKAKGPVDWPHSLRATRAKIVELARARAKDVLADGASDTIAEEEGCDTDEHQQTACVAPKRPLYRQSSMDFMKAEARNWADNDNISRLSHRLQNADRIISTPSFESYATPSSGSISPYRTPSGHPFFPSTPSSTTLNSSQSSSRIPRLRRSMSDMSNSSDSFIMPTIDPRMQRIKRTESFAGSMTCGHGLKRAPSFGAASKRSSGAMSLSGRDSDATSSDEEEKLRSMKAKKARMKTPSPISSPTSHIKHSDASKPQRKPIKSPPAKTTKVSKDATTRRPTKPRANIQRNPSILGGELPHLQTPCEPPTPTRRTPRSARLTTHLSPKLPDATPLEGAALPATPASSKPVRRTKGSRLPNAPVGRKISFGSLASPTDEKGKRFSDAAHGLESAFQLV